MVHGAQLLFCTAVLLSVGAASVLGDRPSARSLSLQAEFSALNETVGGRLYTAVPWELPCFSEYNGTAVTPDEAACAIVQDNYTDPFTRVTHFGAYMASQWETCQAESPNAGCLLDLSEPTDPDAFDGVDCQLGNIPSYYIDVRYPSDVQAALNFSEMTGVRLSVKNKGHDYKGRSSGKGTLALWVTNLNSISHNNSFVPEGCSTAYDAITIGPGAITEDIFGYVDNINRTFIGGYHQTIGAGGGYFLGGGHSVLSPVFGLAVDRVVQVKVVTPNGQYVTANEYQHPELFFALRGGGGSAWGVVFESTHRLAPQVTLQVASIGFTEHANSSNLAEWYELLVNETYRFGTEGWGGHIVGPTIIYVNPLLSNAEANASMKAVADFALGQGGTAVVEELPSYLAFFSKYVTLAEVGVGPETTMGSRLIPTSLFDNEVGRTTLSNTIKSVLSFVNPYIVVGTPFLYNYTVGTTSVTPVTDYTCKGIWTLRTRCIGSAARLVITPAWRDSLWHLSIHSEWIWNSTVEYIAEQYTAVTQHAQLFRDITPGSGAYFNEGDVYEPNHTYSYWGENYEILRDIKEFYDPKGLLDCWQCVGWTGADDPLYECFVEL